MEYLIAAVVLIVMVKRTIRENTKVDYKKYLQSKHWKRTRRKALRRGGNKCALCGNTKELHVHHNNYKNLWHERKTDLIVLCSYHHAMVHNKLYKNNKK